MNHRRSPKQNFYRIGLSMVLPLSGLIIYHRIGILEPLRMDRLQADTILDIKATPTQGAFTRRMARALDIQEFLWEEGEVVEVMEDINL